MLTFLIALGATITGSTGAENLIKNGTFESKEPLASWTDNSMANSNVALSVDSTAAHGGSSSLRLFKSENRFYPIGRVKQVIAAPTNGQRLKIGLWAKASGARKFTIKVTGYDASDKSVSGEWGAYVGDHNNDGKPADHDWMQYWTVIEVPATATTLGIELQMYGPGTVWVDDVFAEIVSADTPLSKALAN